MKRFSFLLLCLFLTLSCALAEEQTFTSGDYTYALQEDGTAKITRYNGKASQLKIPAELDDRAVTVIGDSAFSYRFGLTSITIPDSVTSIGDGAFSSCAALTSVTLPDCLTTIGDRAFYGCDALTNITIPHSVTSIDWNPFADCENLTKIIVSPDHPTLATIEGVLFSKSDKRLICYPCAFTQAEYAVPHGVEVIGDEAFFGCSDLTSITIPDSVTTIGNRAFFNCDGLTSVTLVDSLTIIGSNPFVNCDNLTKIIVSPDHPALATIEGVLFGKSDKRLICYPCAFTQTEYAPPHGIEVVGDRAFCNCDSLISVTLPDSVTIIGYGAFSNCDGLTSVTLPDNLTAIGDWTFFSCDGLTSITIPDSVTSIGDGAFSGCSDLTITVGRNSYAKQYCIDNDLMYTYADSNDWLNG